MVGRKLFRLVALFCLLASRQALAQDESDSAAPLPSLSERLEQFRRDLIGEPGQAERREVEDRAALEQELKAARSGPGARRPQRGAKTQQQPAGQPPAAQPPKATSKALGQRGAPSPQPQQQMQPSASPARQGQAAASQQPPVRTPQRMEVQSARKAKPSGGLFPTTTPPERDGAQPANEDVADVSPSSEAPVSSDESPAPPSDTLTDDSPVDEIQEPQAEQVPQVARATPRQLLAQEPKPADDPAGGPAAAAPKAPHGIASPPTSASPSAPAILFTTTGPELSVEAVGPRKIMIDAESQFVVRIRNRGAAANNVVVSMNIPEYVEVASTHATTGTVPAPSAGEGAGLLEWKISRLDSNKIETLNLVVVPHKSAPLDLAVRYTYAPEASQMLVEVQEPKLAMTISGSKEVLYGDTQVYKLTLSNPGNGNCENVVIGLLPVGRGADGIASHKVGTLRAGESKTIDIELTARQAGTIAIKAQAYADGGLRTEASEQVLVRRANLEITVEAPKLTYAGTVGTYRASVVNTGDAPADKVELAAMLPADAKYVSSSAGGRFDPQQGKVAWSGGSLQPGAQRSFEMQCTLGSPGDNRLQFAASAAGDVSASATSTTQVEALADLKIEVRDPQGPVAVGNEAVYEVVIHNRGSAAANNVDLVVFFSEGLEATSVEGGEHELNTGQVNFSQIAAVGAGQSLVLRVHAKADRGGHHVFRAEMACQSLGTKLAAEESTYYYAVDGAAAAAPADGGAPPSPQQPTPAQAEGQPTPATPRELPPGDEPPAVPE
jgi:uncharacterized repeat protein (TIGR01451 family)